jgi:asparagine synthase (glutamine-hydrolysing)
MCGIVGVWGGSSFDKQMGKSMVSTIAHRGPDSQGSWVNDELRLSLAHCRLSILDLSSVAHQPMVSDCSNYVLVYNGEIYNHLDLRQELESAGVGGWRGHSDTETLLAALRFWGVEKTLKKLNGMFAFAFWHKQRKRLYLARDRMGEKPLFYGESRGTFLFASELKALTVHPDWQGDIDRDALALFMRYSYVPAPWSIYKGILKLPPAHFIVVSEGGHSISSPQCYWDLGEIAETGSHSPILNPEGMVDELDVLLRDAVKRRMASDVPLGSFLSGGYDSSIVTALMQAQSDHPVKTFTIGFHDQGYNEAHHAKEIAKHLGTEHTELYVTPEEAMGVIPMLPTIYDEPFSDSSQIPTFLVSQLARQNVTVSLSGDGGDELFCGYNRYLLGYRAWQKLRLFPPSIRRLLAWTLNHTPGHVLDAMQMKLPQRFRVPNLSDRLPKLAEVLVHPDGESFYHQLVSHWKSPDQVVLGSTEHKTILSQPDSLPNISGLRERMMYLDMMTYLPDDILTKVDRASMAVSLEARVPLLDHRVVEFAWQVPTEYKYRDGKGKWLLRQVLYRYIPQDIMDRPKMGFGVPIESWLRGPLRDWAETMLNEKRLREEGYFDAGLIRQMWSEHILGKRRWHYYLWDVLMFQAWLAHWRNT